MKDLKYFIPIIGIFLIPKESEVEGVSFFLPWLFVQVGSISVILTLLNKLFIL